MIFSSFFLLIATRYSRCLKPSSSLSLFLNIKISYGILFNLQFQPLNKSLWQQGRIVHTSFSLQDFTSLIECFMHIYFHSSFILLIPLLKISTKTLSFKWTTTTKYIPPPSSLFDVHAQGPILFCDTMPLTAHLLFHVLVHICKWYMDLCLPPSLLMYLSTTHGTKFSHLIDQSDWVWSRGFNWMLELSLPTYCTSYLIYWECSYDQSTKYIGCTIPFLDVQYVWDSPSSLSLLPIWILSYFAMRCCRRRCQWRMSLSGRWSLRQSLSGESVRSRLGYRRPPPDVG